MTYNLLMYIELCGASHVVILDTIDSVMYNSIVSSYIAMQEMYQFQLDDNNYAIQCDDKVKP